MDFSPDYSGVAREKPKEPFAQVTGNVFGLSKILKNKFLNSPHMKNVLVAYGVVFPDIEFKPVFQEIILEIIYDNRIKDITEYIKGTGQSGSIENHLCFQK